VKIIDVQPKDIHVTIEFSLKQLKNIESFLKRSQVEFNSTEEPEMLEVFQYVIDEFYPALLEFLNNLEKG
jgi:hypothetical protein